MDTNRTDVGQGSDRSSEEPVKGAYDATKDPRTGRPPNPLEAQRLARERELERAEDGQATQDSENVDENALAKEQAPGRMASPGNGDDTKAAIDALVKEGIARETAEQLVEEHGSDWERLKAAAWPEIVEDEDLLERR